MTSLKESRDGTTLTFEAVGMDGKGGDGSDFTGVPILLG